MANPAVHRTSRESQCPQAVFVVWQVRAAHDPRELAGDEVPANKCYRAQEGCQGLIATTQCNCKVLNTAFISEAPCILLHHKGRQASKCIVSWTYKIPESIASLSAAYLYSRFSSYVGYGHEGGWSAAEYHGSSQKCRFKSCRKLRTCATPGPSCCSVTGLPSFTSAHNNT
eukprot:scaffold476176_cov19-Prasinocladus_malaysianus.AAC.1